jgi:hypothetical protein
LEVSPRARERHRLDWPTPDDMPRPSSGDLALGCVHALSLARQAAGGGKDAGMHVFHVDGGIDYTRNDGTRGHAQWIQMCRACFAVYRDRPLDCPCNTDALLLAEH